MVRKNQAYKGSQNFTKIKVNNGKLTKKIYKGSTLIYKYGFDPITFYPSSSIQSWKVPEGISKIHVDCVASRGMNSEWNASVIGGNGGRVQCDLDVTEGQTLYLVIGGIPTTQEASYNASDIRTNNTGILDNTSLNSRLIVAGGGGTAGGYQVVFAGGAGGGLTGEHGKQYSDQGGSGGTQTSGGAGGGGSSGWYGSAGSFGLGGTNTSNINGGAGGAGWYGGGSGGVWGHDKLSYCGGGGGGSSYTDENKCSNVVHTQGFNNNTGYITISEV